MWFPDLSKLEPFGLFCLAGGVLYSIGALTWQSTNYKFHFTVLTLVIFVALVSITTFKYMKYRLTCERMDDIMAAMKIQ